MPTSIEAELSRLPEAFQALLARYNFDAARFEALSGKLKAGGTSDNRVKGRVESPTDEDVVRLPARGSKEWAELEARGLEALKNGECALVVLAGGMATRMGGVVKALVEALPGKTFLDLRLAEIESLRKKAGKAPPLWLMSSYSTHDKLLNALGSGVDNDSAAVFPQYLSLRLTPDGHVFLDRNGAPSEHAPGHGDLPDALRASGLLGRFVDRGGKVVMVANLDNLGATLDPALVGWQLLHGTQAACEVVEKVGADRGGIPARLDGRPVILEEFRLPEAFDAATVRVFNTNTFQFDARALLELNMDWTYFIVEKKVDGSPVVQFERLIGEITSHLKTRFLLVPRTGGDSRFLPVKDNEELEKRRSEIQSGVSTRGILP